jgi:hypothetical protein
VYGLISDPQSRVIIYSKRRQRNLPSLYSYERVAVDLRAKLSYQRAGLTLPNEGQSICKDGEQHDDTETGIAAGTPAIFVRPLRQNSGLDTGPPQKRFGWPFASLERGQGTTQGSHHSYTRSA